MSKNLELRSLCDQEMKSRGWNVRPELVKRLNEEIADIEARDEAEFFLECRERKEIYDNENNLLVTYLIGICEEVNLDEPSACDYGEFPDIDVDFIPKVRDILKEEFAPNRYGKERVCNIATYGKFGIRSALIDTARVLGHDRKDILNLTTNLSVKDDEGETLSWDKAIELYPDLRKYLEKHPDLAKAASRLLNRIRQIGVHASGLIISGVTIDDFVPLVKPKQDGQVASAWVEGLSGSDLGAVGLVKFDFLGLDALQKIGETCHLNQQAYAKLSSRATMHKEILDSLDGKVSALPGGTHFSDDSYLSDPKSLAMASRGELKMVFQFDGSPGIRQLARQGGVDRFEDLMSYTSLYRPGPLASGFHDAYCRRKNNQEKYEIHPILGPITNKTYGLLIYQEQIMQVLNKAGGIPLKDCEAIRKAISKKKVEKFIKYKEIFKTNGKKILGYTDEQMEELWQTIEAWAGYGFNRSMTIGTSIKTKDGFKQIQHFMPGDIVYSVNERGQTVEVPVVALHDHGTIEGFEVFFDDDTSVVCSINHKFLTENGQQPLWKIMEDDSVVLSSIKGCNAERRGIISWSYCFDSSQHGMLPFQNRGNETRVVPPTHGHAGISDARSLVSRKIVRVVPVGERRMYDLEVGISTHNFLLANGVVTSNSHAACYSVVSAQELYLKAHLPEHYIPGYLNNFTTSNPDDYQKMKEYLMDADRNGVPCERTHFNNSKATFVYADGKMYYPFEKLKGIGEEVAIRIEQAQPFKDYQDFLEKFGADAKANQALVAIGAFPGDRKRNWQYYLAYRTWHDRQVETRKRIAAQNQKFQDEIERLTGIRPTVALSREAIEDVHARYPEGDILYKRIRKFTKQLVRVVNNQEVRLKEPKPMLETFVPSEAEIEKPMGTLLEQPQSYADREYYGFAWVHPVDEALGTVNGSRNTFEDLEMNPMIFGSAEVLILEVEKRLSKKNTNFYSVKAEDSTGKQKFITVWDTDFNRFENELLKGNVVRIRIKKPDPGSQFRTLTIAPHNGKTRWQPPPKAQDFRVTVLKWRECDS